jgi:predicted DNA-binding WGR domain protein
MTTKKSNSRTESAGDVMANSWRIPAIATQLHRINQSSSGRSPDLVDNQIIGFRDESGIALFKVSLVTSNRPESCDSDRVDMLIASSIEGESVKTLTYWTDFDREIILPRARDGGKCFVADLLRPEVTVIGGDVEVSALAASNAGISYTAKHNWPALTKAQSKNIVRMEATENGEWKFWSIWHNGSKVYYHHGRIGETSGNEGSYVGASVSSSGGIEAFVQRKIAEKTLKGYAKV